MSCTWISSRLTDICSHSFKILPNIGKHVVELLEGTLADDLRDAWRWRPGGDALKSRREAAAKDLSEFPGWEHAEGTEAPSEDSAKKTNGVKDVTKGLEQLAVEL
jgi:hypothetical protein